MVQAVRCHSSAATISSSFVHIAHLSSTSFLQVHTKHKHRNTNTLNEANKLVYNTSTKTPSFFGCSFHNTYTHTIHEHIIYRTSLCLTVSQFSQMVQRISFIHASSLCHLCCAIYIFSSLAINQPYGRSVEIYIYIYRWKERTEYICVTCQCGVGTSTI